MKDTKIDGGFAPEKHAPVKHKKGTLKCGVCGWQTHEKTIIKFWAIDVEVCASCVKDRVHATDLISHFSKLLKQHFTYEISYHLRSEVQAHFGTGPGYTYGDALLFFTNFNVAHLPNVLAAKTKQININH